MPARCAKSLSYRHFCGPKPSFRRIETDLSWLSGTIEEDERVRAMQKTLMSSYEPFSTYLDHTRVDSRITSGAYPLSIVVTLVAFWPVLHVPMYTTYTSAKGRTYGLERTSRRAASVCAKTPKWWSVRCFRFSAGLRISAPSVCPCANCGANLNADGAKLEAGSACDYYFFFPFLGSR